MTRVVVATLLTAGKHSRNRRARHRNGMICGTKCWSAQSARDSGRARIGGTMTRYAVLAAVPALALGAPAFADELPIADPPAPVAPAPAVQVQPPPVTMHTDPATGQTVATMVLPTVPSPGFVWIPGHYNWDPDRHTYVWLVGQYVQRPRENAHWVDGRWQLQPDGWVWVDGHWE